MKINLDLITLQSDLKTKSVDGKPCIWDPIRKKYLVLQPEELVRQLLLNHLIKRQNYPQNFIAVEKGLDVNGLKKRFDVLVYNPNYEPFLLIECKAPSISLSEDTFRQAAQYNSQFKAPYLLITNGPDTYCSQLDHETKSFDFLSHLPDFPHHNR